MSGNPFAAPKAAVADAVDDTARRTRPAQVTVAVILMWLTFVIGLLGVVENWEEFVTLAPRVVSVVLALMATLLVLLNVMVFRGHDWARIVYLVLFCVGIPRTLRELPPIFDESIAAGVLALGQAAVQFTVLVLLFTAPGRYWFQRAAAQRRLFSYGSLQRAEVQRSTFGRTLVARPDELPGFERAISRGPAGHANVIRSGHVDSRVGGLVLELTDQDLARADEYERAEGYERIEVTLASGTLCWVYREAQAEAAT